MQLLKAKNRLKFSRSLKSYDTILTMKFFFVLHQRIFFFFFSFITQKKVSLNLHKILFQWYFTADFYSVIVTNSVKDCRKKNFRFIIWMFFSDWCYFYPIFSILSEFICNCFYYFCATTGLEFLEFFYTEIRVYCCLGLEK